MKTIVLGDVSPILNSNRLKCLALWQCWLVPSNWIENGWNTTKTIVFR